MEETRVKKENNVTITLRVQKEGTKDFFYTMRRDEKLEKLMIAYCERRQLGDYRSLRFHVDGDRVRGYQTPRELELDNGYVIDAWSELPSAKEEAVLLDRSRVKKEDNNYVTLTVQKQGCEDFYFTIKRDTALLELMIIYCHRYHLGYYKTIQFHKDDGSRIQDHQTPNEVELENGDVIDAWELSTGGAHEYSGNAS